jgi:hypothetical protein
LVDNNNKIQNKKKTIILVTDNIQHYQQEYDNCNISNYNIVSIDWNDVSNLITDINDTKLRNIELVILDISMEIIEKASNNKINSTPTTIATIIEKIKTIFADKRVFFILPSESMVQNFLINGINAKKEDIRIQPFSVYDLIDLISINKKKEKIDRLKLKDHALISYSSIDDKINDAIKFLKIGIKNNEVTILALSKDIESSYLQSQMKLHDLDINKLQDNGLLKITNSEDWYLTSNKKRDDDTINNKKNTIPTAINIKELHKQKLNDIIDRVIKNEGREGLRAFCMMDCFFQYGLIDELIDFECVFLPRFNKPYLGVCVYNDSHIAELSEDQMRRLVLTHNSVSI